MNRLTHLNLEVRTFADGKRVTRRNRGYSRDRNLSGLKPDGLQGRLHSAGYPILYFHLLLHTMESNRTKYAYICLIGLGGHPQNASVFNNGRDRWIDTWTFPVRALLVRGQAAVTDDAVYRFGTAFLPCIASNTSKP